MVVFDCKPYGPERDLSGEWLEKGTGVANAEIKGLHLLLPGFGENGPTLEIFQYPENLDKHPTAANRKGFGHIAFKVDNVADYVQKVLNHGGSLVGETVVGNIPGAGPLSFAYVTDPDGNMIELQKWG